MNKSNNAKHLSFTKNRFLVLSPKDICYTQDTKYNGRHRAQTCGRSWRTVTFCWARPEAIHSKSGFGSWGTAKKGNTEAGVLIDMSDLDHGDSHQFLCLGQFYGFCRTVELEGCQSKLLLSLSSVCACDPGVPSQVASWGGAVSGLWRSLGQQGKLSLD